MNQILHIFYQYNGTAKYRGLPNQVIKKMFTWQKNIIVIKMTIIVEEFIPQGRVPI